MTGIDPGRSPNTDINHAFVSQIALTELLQELEWPEELADLVSDAVGCHHGERASPITLIDLAGDRRAMGRDPWAEARQGLFEALVYVFKPASRPTACNRITAGITRELMGERPIKAVLDAYNPVGSTRHVNFNTSRSLRWETEATRSHVNWVVLDSDWEGEFCRVAEALGARGEPLGHARPLGVRGVPGRVPDRRGVREEGEGGVRQDDRATV